MATLARTIIINETKDISDAQLLKALKLHRKVRSDDQHKIGAPNIPYYDSLNRNQEVFVGTFEGNTIIVSSNIPEDFNY